MAGVLRFWFRSQDPEVGYATEVMLSGWVPLLPVRAVAAVARAADVVAPVALPMQDSDGADLLTRFYANQGC